MKLICLSCKETLYEWPDWGDEVHTLPKCVKCKGDDMEFEKRQYCTMCQGEQTFVSKYKEYGYECVICGTTVYYMRNSTDLTGKGLGSPTGGWYDIPDEQLYDQLI